MHDAPRGHADTHLILALLGCVLHCSLACGYSVPGDENNMMFRPGSSSFEPLSRPLVVGGTTTLEAGSFEGGAQLKIFSVTSSDTSVLTVDFVNDDIFSITGASAGMATLRVGAFVVGTGDFVDDEITITVEDAGQIDIEHICMSDETIRHALYLPDAPMALEYEVMNTAGGRLIGDGFDPIADGSLINASVELLKASALYKGVTLRTADAPGTDVSFALTTGPSDLTASIVDPAFLDGAIRASVFGELLDYQEGDYDVLRFRPALAGTPVCGATVAEVTSLTPSVCTFTRLLEEDAELFNFFTNQSVGWWDAEMATAGTCTYEVRFEGLATPLLGSFEVAPAPPTP